MKSEVKEILLDHLTGEIIKSVKFRQTENGLFQLTISTKDDHMVLTVSDEFPHLSHHYGHGDTSIDYVFNHDQFSMDKILL